LSLEKIPVTPPDAPAPVIKGISLLVEPGSMLAVIGPNAPASPLARAMLGIYSPSPGRSGDGAELDQWDREALGHYIGATCRGCGIARRECEREHRALRRHRRGQGGRSRPQATRVHEMILRLPEATTRLVGNVVSAGQRQRIGSPGPCTGIRG
jgi:ABC-type protease/lipase transport system fused ATPase/permease subunit